MQDDLDIVTRDPPLSLWDSGMLAAGTLGIVRARYERYGQRKQVAVGRIYRLTSTVTGNPTLPIRTIDVLTAVATGEKVKMAADRI